MASIRELPPPRWRDSLLVTASAIVGIATAVSPAQAQQPGVVYGPGGPSSKEIAIPLEEARRDAGGSRPGRTESLPFGLGISRRGEGAPRSGAGGTRREAAGPPFLWKLAPLLVLAPGLLVGLLLARRQGQRRLPQPG